MAIVTARLKIESEEYAGEYSWGIYEFPIDYTAKDYCNSKMFGRRPILNLDDSLGKLVLHSENSEEIQLSTDQVNEKKNHLRGSPGCHT